MNVALIIERIETWRGGAETSTMQFAEHLAADGCRVSILSTSYPPSTPSLNIVPILVNGRMRALRTGLFVKRAQEYVRTNRFDIVHCITPCPFADVYQPRGGTVPETLARNLAMRGSPVRRVLKQLGQRINLKYRVISGFERQLLSRRPWVIAISRYVADQLQRHYRFDPQRVRLIFNGVDPDISTPAERASHRAQLRRQFGMKDTDLMLLCVAHNFRLKGVGPLIRALAWRVERERAGTARAGRASVVVVGRDNPAPFTKLAEQLNIRDRVLFTGPTPRVQAFFHAADVLVHDTYYDPCSRVVLEALGSGLPVITTRFNGAAERIVDGREGYVIDSPDDVPALADRIERLADPEHRRACAANAPRAVEGISMRDHARQVLALYEEILRSGQAGRGERG
ncbi:MAG TPA: glycosyltransferase family 4 protein [Phycisphaerae bacterium]|jgi:UDP-glucose:(heptosyl)LPS alpha-1,3-glucosyltransferase|nr:glycosyltransferase family 4 protein [Phycisphaerae bacterium]HOJ55316.1 glycosyltransferase family 4 protein [Phycisphaerae bacterium]HOL27396.1 glycosyltransferase family 4 protein [Phycisphaerae bacterium]HPP21619.1 glycosyltransferase family 4 protein [Phycisphaerae bacterium]HPU33903.1 glycosyltransferase family 4 protein [Phycisphaerae bacterium]